MMPMKATISVTRKATTTITEIQVSKSTTSWPIVMINKNEDDKSSGDESHAANKKADPTQLDISSVEKSEGVHRNITNMINVDDDIIKADNDNINNNISIRPPKMPLT